MIIEILFNKNQLKLLKDKIDLLKAGRINAKELRQQIIDFRIEIVKKLFEFFPYYFRISST